MYKLYSNIICSIAFSYFCCAIVHGSSTAMVVYEGVPSAIQIANKEDAAQCLGVSVFASQQEIKKAYHRLALKFHPDKQKKSNEMFLNLDKAYCILMQPILFELHCRIVKELFKEGKPALFTEDILNISSVNNANALFSDLNKYLDFLQSKNRTKESCNKKFGMHKYPAIKKEVENIFKQKKYEECLDIEKTMQDLESQANKIAYQSKLRLLAENSQELSWHSKIAIFGKKEKQPDPCKGPRYVMQCNEEYKLDSVARQIFCKSNHVELDKKNQDIDNQLCKARLGSIATVGAVSSLGLVITGIMLRYKNS